LFRYIGVTFDGWSDAYDYTELLSFEGFHPVGWAQRHSNPIQAPGRDVPAPERGWSDPFDWRGYLARTRTTAVDAAVLTATTPPGATGGGVAAAAAAAAAGGGGGGGSGGGREEGSNSVTTAEAWAAQQRAAIRRRPWMPCRSICDELARGGAQAAPSLPLPLQHGGTSEETDAPWYMLIAGTQLRRSWQPDAAEIGDLQARDVVQVLEIVTGQRHFPTDVGVLDLRAMARCDRGWFQCRNHQGASAVRPADPPQQ
jgi:hypothetical protein